MPYNALETQRLLRNVENGAHRLLPGGELVDSLYRQLKEADGLIRQQDDALRAGSRGGEPSVGPLAFTPARIIPSEHNPMGLTSEGTDSRTVQPAALAPQRNLQPPRNGEFNSFMATGGVEAPPPIPFSETPGGVPLQPPPDPVKKKGRKIKLK